RRVWRHRGAARDRNRGAGGVASGVAGRVTNPGNMNDVRTAPREGAGTSENYLPTLRVIGPGRAGRSLSLALDRAGWRVLPPVAHGDDVAHAADGTDLLVIA